MSALFSIQHPPYVSVANFFLRPFKLKLLRETPSKARLQQESQRMSRFSSITCPHWSPSDLFSKYHKQERTSAKLSNTGTCISTLILATMPSMVRTGI